MSTGLVVTQWTLTASKVSTDSFRHVSVAEPLALHWFTP